MPILFTNKVGVFGSGFDGKAGAGVDFPYLLDAFVQKLLNHLRDELPRRLIQRKNDVALLDIFDGYILPFIRPRAVGALLPALKLG